MGQTIAIIGGKQTIHNLMIAANLFAVISSKSETSIQLIDFYLDNPTNHIFFESIISENKEIKRKIPIYNKERCVYCGACSKFCSYKGIIFIKAIPYIQIIQNACRACGACFFACDHTALKSTEKLLGSLTKYSTSNNETILNGKIGNDIPYSLPLIKELKKQINKDFINILDIPLSKPTQLLESIKNVDFILLISENTNDSLEQLKQTLEIIKGEGISTSVFFNKINQQENHALEFLETQQIPIIAQLEINTKIIDAINNQKLLVNINSNYKELFLNLFREIERLS